MRSMLVWLAGVALSSPALAGEVTFHRNDPATGASWNIKNVDNMAMDMTIKMGTMEQPGGNMEQQSKAVRTETVLNNEDGMITQLQVAYGPTTVKVKSQMGEQEMEAPHQNKTFVVSWQEGAYQVKDTDGVDVDAALASEIVEKSGARVGPNALANLLTAQPVTTGQEFVVPPAVAAQIMGDQDELKADMKLTLSDAPVENGVAVFAVNMTVGFVGQDPNMGAINLDFEMTGDLMVQTESSRIVGWKIGGPVTMNGTMEQGGMKIEMVGKGTVDQNVSLAPAAAVTAEN